MNRIALVVLIVCGLASCNNNPFKNVDLSDTHINYEFRDFDQDLFSFDYQNDTSFTALDAQYPTILPVFTTEIIRIGYPSDPEFGTMLKSFVEDTLMQSVKKDIDQLIDKDKLSDDLQESFTYFKYYFKDIPTPTVFSCLSGFNQSIVMTDSLMGIGVDKYLGRDYEYYPQLGVYDYQIKNMYPDKMVPDAMYAWTMYNYPFKGYGSTLIDKMVYEGKLLYVLDAVLPDVEDSVKIGFTTAQMDFCTASEDNMWRYLAEHKMLFSNKRMDIVRYTGEAPYTSSFSAESPGRTGNWIGWQIVRSYMKSHPELSISELMEIKDGKQILNQSGYHP